MFENRHDFKISVFGANFLFNGSFDAGHYFSFFKENLSKDLLSQPPVLDSLPIEILHFIEA